MKALKHGDKIGFKHGAKIVHAVIRAINTTYGTQKFLVEFDDGQRMVGVDASKVISVNRG